MAYNHDKDPSCLSFKAEFVRIREEEGEERARTFLIHYIRIADSVKNFQDTRKYPFLECEQPGCNFVTRQVVEKNRRTALEGHHCQVLDRMKAGAYALVAIDQTTCKVVSIGYVGFGGNL